MSKLSYLIGTGAEVSVLPPRSEDRDRSPVNNMQLQAANGTAIRTFGQRSVAVELGLAQSRLSGASPLQMYRNRSSVPISCATMDY